MTSTIVDLAEELTNYIWYEVQHHARTYEPMIEQPNGDYNYREEAQDIFLAVLDILELSEEV
jgi:hypothetical protein